MSRQITVATAPSHMEMTNVSAKPEIAVMFEKVKLPFSASVKA